MIGGGANAAQFGTGTFGAVRRLGIPFFNTQWAKAPSTAISDLFQIGTAALSENVMSIGDRPSPSLNPLGLKGLWGSTPSLLRHNLKPINKGHLKRLATFVLHFFCSIGKGAQPMNARYTAKTPQDPQAGSAKTALALPRVKL